MRSPAAGTIPRPCSHAPASKADCRRARSRLAQQASGARAEARIEEPLVQASRRPARLRREQAVVALHVVLGAQVLEVDPGRPRLARGHPAQVALRQTATERLDDRLARLDARVVVGRPRAHLDARRAAGRHPGERAGIVAPEAHGVAAGSRGPPPGASTRRCRRSCRRRGRTDPSASADYRGRPGRPVRRAGLRSRSASRSRWHGWGECGRSPKRAGRCASSRRTGGCATRPCRHDPSRRSRATGRTTSPR